MKVLNLLYDAAFKYVMDNDNMAKKVMSIILNSKIISLESKPTETILEDKGAISVLRFDFKAVIETETGENKVVLIELQKYKSKNPIARFRNYLAKNYMHKEMVKDPKTGKQEAKDLPIISVYILGYDLPEFSTRAIHTKNIPYNIFTGEQLQNVYSEYVELLTHSSIILIAASKPDVVSSGTCLEKFLNLFIQKLQGEEANYIIELDEENTAKTEDMEMKEIIGYLNRGTLDEKLIRQLDHEQEYAETIIDLEENLKLTQKEKEEERRQKEEERRQKEEERRQKEEERRQKEEVQKQKEEERRQKEEERRQKEEAQKREKEKSVKLARMMLNANMPIDEIAKETGLSKNEIEEL